MKNKSFSLHVHLGRCAREDPWLGDPDVDAAAAPYRDALEAAYHDAWGPNTAAALLAEDGLLRGSANNFARASWSAEPWVLAWLERRHPRAYARLLQADALALSALGHGNALASAEPPLDLRDAGPRGRRACIRWGLADFALRFGRRAEGFWLPGGADEAALELLAGEGVSFVLVDADEALAVRPMGAGAEGWSRVDGATLDSGLPYAWLPASGRGLSLLFFRRVEPPGRDPRRFAVRIADSFRPGDAVELRLLAADAAVFSQARARGERALAYALEAIPGETPVRRTIPAVFLDRHPAPMEARLKSPPGEERGGGPLREASAGLSSALAERFETQGRTFFRDPWAALDDYGPLALRPDAHGAEGLLRRHCLAHPTPGQARAALRLLEGARWSLELRLPGTDEERLAAAARALEILQPPEEVQRRFLEELSRIPADEERSLRDAYEAVRRARSLSPEALAAHAAARAHLGLGGEDPFAWELRAEPLGRWEVPDGPRPAAASLWAVFVRSRRDFERLDSGAAVVQRGASLDLWLPPSAEAAGAAAAVLSAARDGPGLERALRGAFGEPKRGLDALLPEVRREAARELRPLGAGKARELKDSWCALVGRLRRDEAGEEEAFALLEEAARAGLEPDSLPGACELRLRLRRRAEAFAAQPGAGSAERLDEGLATAARCGLHLPLWEFQDLALAGLACLGPEAGPAARRRAARLGISPETFAEGPWSRASCS